MWSLLNKYDYKETKLKVEDVLMDYKELKLKLDNIPYYSASQLKFVYVNSGINTNDVVSNVGEYEIRKQDEERREYLRIVNAYEKLFEEDQIIIGNLYFKTRRGCTNDELMYELDMGRDSFYNAKKEAIVNFGVALGVAVSKQMAKGGM